MTDKTPNQEDNISKDEKSIRKDNESPEISRDVNDLRNEKDLLDWLDKAAKVTRRSKQQETVNRRRTTIVDMKVPDELEDIIGKGQWVEAPTPDQIKKIQSTPAALKNMIDFVSSLSSVQSTSPSASSSSPLSIPSPGGSAQGGLTPEIIQRRIDDTKRFLNPFLAELEEHQLKFTLIILLFIIILIHLGVSLLTNN